jgi:hypothetical protein
VLQVLGRRRHTICQIGDSSTPPDTIAKAKQYNYVRKFSVDISALQVQLQCLSCLYYVLEEAGKWSSNDRIWFPRLYKQEIFISILKQSSM